MSDLSRERWFGNRIRWAISVLRRTKETPNYEVISGNGADLIGRFRSKERALKAVEEMRQFDPDGDYVVVEVDRNGYAIGLPKEPVSTRVREDDEDGPCPSCEDGCERCDPRFLSKDEKE